MPNGVFGVTVRHQGVQSRVGLGLDTVPPSNVASHQCSSPDSRLVAQKARLMLGHNVFSFFFCLALKKEKNNAMRQSSAL